MSRIAERLISSDDYLNPVDELLGDDPMATIVSAAQGGTGQDTSSVTGQPELRSGTWYFPSNHINVVSHGAATGASAADNTTAFDAAIAEAISTGAAVYVPNGSWNLNALADITGPVRLFGSGRGTKLIFNTAADAIFINPAVPNQGDTYHIHNLSFDNVTNVPASYIRNNQGINVRLDHLYFRDCAATYCVDNENGYGLKIGDSLFFNVTGSGVRLRDDLILAGNDYSYVASITECDFSGLSGTGIVVAGAQVLKITSTVVEGCGGKGIDVQAGVGGAVQAWGLILDGVYFELNTGTDLDLQSTGAGWCDATLIGCTFVGTSTIALGVKSRLLIQGTSCGGGNEVTVTGSTLAHATLINTSGVLQSGTFSWVEFGGIDKFSTTVPLAYTPAWGSLGVQPVLGDGTLTGWFTRIGNTVSAHIELVIGTTTTLGTGSWYLTLPFNATYSFQIGTMYIYSPMVGFWSGLAATNAAVTTIALTIPRGDTVANTPSASVPILWVATDTLVVEITYQV